MCAGSCYGPQDVSRLGKRSRTVEAACTPNRKAPAPPASWKWGEHDHIKDPFITSPGVSKTADSRSRRDVAARSCMQRRRKGHDIDGRRHHSGAGDDRRSRDHSRGEPRDHRRRHRGAGAERIGDLPDAWPARRRGDLSRLRQQRGHTRARLPRDACRHAGNSRLPQRARWLGWPADQAGDLRGEGLARDVAGLCPGAGWEERGARPHRPRPVP